MEQKITKMLEEDLFVMAKKSGYINASMTWNDFKKRYKIESQERQNAQSILPRNTGNPFANNQQGNEQ